MWDVASQPHPTFNIPHRPSSRLIAAAVLLLPRFEAAAQVPPIGGARTPPGNHNSGVRPNNQLGCQVHLPVLDFLGQDDVCESWIEIQNVGCEYAKAALVAWGEPGLPKLLFVTRTSPTCSVSRWGSKR